MSDADNDRGVRRRTSEYPPPLVISRFPVRQARPEDILATDAKYGPCWKMNHRGTSGRLSAQINGEVIRYCFFRYRPDYGYLRALYIQPDYNKLGVGFFILKKALEMLETRDRIYLDIARSNESAISFFQQFGFLKTDGDLSFTETVPSKGEQVALQHLVWQKVATF